MSSTTLRHDLEAELRSPAFADAVNELLDELARAEDTSDKKRAVAKLAGELRRRQLAARLSLTHELLEERLRVTPTMHVAKYVMAETFGVATKFEILKDRWANKKRDDSGRVVDMVVSRGANEKVMVEAKTAVAASRRVIDEYRRDYEWFLVELTRQYEKIKARRRQEASP